MPFEFPQLRILHRSAVASMAALGIFCIFCFSTPAAQSQTFEYHVSSAIGPAGSTQTISFLLDASGSLDGWSFGLCHDPAICSIVSAEIGSAVVAAAAEFTVIDTEHDGGLTAGAVIALAPPFLQLAPGTDLELLRVDYRIVGEPGAASLLEPCNTLGSPPVALIVVTNNTEVDPSFSAGSLEVLDAPVFIRGDANQDSIVNILDAIRLLEMLFLGTFPVLCEDQVDSNDDEVVNILDVIYTLEVAVTGESVMPAPYPSCGDDPTEVDAPDCATPPAICP